MSEPLLQAQVESGERLWDKAPAWRNLTMAASLLTLAAVAVPVLLPEQPASLPVAAKPVAAPAAVLPPPARQARAEMPVTRPAHATALVAAPPQPAPVQADAQAASDLPAGGLVVPSGVLTRVNQHNRRIGTNDLPISITIVSPPSHGTVTTHDTMALLQVAPGVERNSRVTQVFYQSASGYAGRDSFTYQRTSSDPNDPRNTNTYTMVIDVRGPASSAPASSGHAPAPASAPAPNVMLQPAAQPAQSGQCSLAMGYDARAMGTGIVIGFENPAQAQRRVIANQQAMGGMINPAYATTPRLIVQMDGPAGAPSQIVVAPPGMTAQIGDRVSFNAIRRDPNMACAFIPPLLTFDAGPPAQGAAARPAQ